MVDLVKINNLNRGFCNEDVSYINPYHISSINVIGSQDSLYDIVMINGTRYSTDKESFEKALEVLSD